MSIVTKFKTALIVVIFATAGLFAVEAPQNPTVPDAPVVPGPQINDVTSTEMMSNDVRGTDSRILYQPLWKSVRITEYGSQPVEGMLKFTSNFLLVVTNRVSNRTSINRFYIADIVRLEITKWRAVEQTGGIFKFIPVEYKILCGSYYVYTGNIPFFNLFEIEIDGNRRGAFTIFYDRWIPGQNGKFYWENSRSFDFSYNFTHPLRGVTMLIEFSYSGSGL